MCSFKNIFLLCVVLAALQFVSAARILDIGSASAWASEHFDTAIDDLEELLKERFDPKFTKYNGLDKNEHHAREEFKKILGAVKENDLVKHVIEKQEDLLGNVMDVANEQIKIGKNILLAHGAVKDNDLAKHVIEKRDNLFENVMDVADEPKRSGKNIILAHESNKQTTFEHLLVKELDCEPEEISTQWNTLEHLLDKMEHHCKESYNDMKNAPEKTLKLGKIVDFFIGKSLKLDALDLVKDLMKLRLTFLKKDKGTGKIGDVKGFLEKVIEIGTNILTLEGKHEHLKDKAGNAIHGIVEKHDLKHHKDFFSPIKEIGEKIYGLINEHEWNGAGDIDNNLLKHIKEIEFKIFKIAEVFDKKGGKIHISEFLPDFKVIENKIHEMKEKHGVKKDGKYKNLFGYIDEVGTKIHDILEKYAETKKGDSLQNLKEMVEKLLIAKGIGHEAKHVAEKGLELKEKLAETIKYILEKNKLFHKVDNEHDFIKHVFEKVFKHDKEEVKGEFIKDTLENGKKIVEDAKHLLEKGQKFQFEHIIEKLIKHKKEDLGEFHMFDKVFKLQPKEDKEDEDNFFRHLKEIGKKIHEMIQKQKRHRGEHIKYDLLENIKKIGTKISKIVEIHDKIGDKVHISEFLKHFKEIKKDIHELKEKHEKKEGKKHKGLFKYFEGVGEKIHHLLGKYDKITEEDHKGDFFHHMKEKADKLLIAGGIVHETKHLAEKDIELKEKLAETIKHILEKTKSFHKIDNEHDFIKHAFEKVFKHDKKEGKGELIKDTFENGKKIVEDVKHLVQKGEKHHFEHIIEKLMKHKKEDLGEFHIFEKVFKHHLKEDKEDEGHFFRHLKEIGEKIYEIIQKQKGHKGEHIKYDLLEYIKKIGMKIFKIVEIHDKIGDKVHISEFLKHLKEIEKDIHEMKEKHEEKEGEKHKSLFKYFEGVGEKIHYLLGKHDKITEEDHKGDFFHHMKEKADKLLIAGGIVHETKHLAEKDIELKEKLAETIKHILEKNKLFHKIDNEHDFIKHAFEKVFKHDKKEGKGELIKDTFENGKKIVEDVKHLVEKGEKLHFEHIIDKLMKHKKEDLGEFHIFEEVFKHHLKEDKEGEVHFFRHLKEIGEKIYEIIQKQKGPKGEHIKYDLLEHIKKIGTKIFKIVEIHDKIGDKVHISEFLKHLKEIEKDIHELKEKHEDKEGEHHEALFKYFGEVGKKIHHLLGKHDKITEEDHKGNFLHHMKEIGEALLIKGGIEHEVKKFKDDSSEHIKRDKTLVEGITHVIEKGKDFDEAFIESIKHILEKNKILHKIENGEHFPKHVLEKVFEHIKKEKEEKSIIHEIKNILEKGKIHHNIEKEGDFIKHAFEEVFKHDKEKGKGVIIEDAIAKEKKIVEVIKHAVKEGIEVESFKHIIEKLLKHHEKGEDESYKHVFEKIFKHHSEHVEDDHGHFFLNIKEIGKKFHEMIKKLEAHGEEFIKGNLYHHIKEIGMKIFKIEEEHEKLEGKVHIEHFLLSLKEIVKKIHEVKEKYEEKEYEKHKGLFKYIGDIGEKFHDVIKKHDKSIKDHKWNFLHHMKIKGEEILIAEEIKHIMKEILEDKTKHMIFHAIGNEKEIKFIEEFIHILIKKMKLHKIENVGDIIKHVFEKVFKHHHGEFIEDTIKIGKKLFEGIKKVIEKGTKIDEIVDGFKHAMEKLMKHHKIEHGGDFFKHLFDAVFKHGKEDIEKQFLKATIGFGKKIEEGEKAHEVFDVIKHILEKQKKIHELENGGELIKNSFEKIFVKTLEKGEKLEGFDHILEGKKELDKLLLIDGNKHLIEKLLKHHEKGDETHKHVFEKIFKHYSEHVEDDHGHFFLHIKEIGKKFHELIKQLETHGEEFIKGNSYHHIKEIGMKLFKIEEEHEKLRGNVHIEHFLLSLKEIVKEIHEVKEKYEEKEYEKHKGLFKYIEAIGEKFQDVIKKHEKSIKDHKWNFLHHMKTKGEEILIAEEIKHIMKEILEDKTKHTIFHAIGNEKEIKFIEEFIHILIKKMKLHKIENVGDIIKHVFEKVFKHHHGEFIEDTIKIGKKLFEGIKKVIEKGTKIDEIVDGFKHAMEKLMKHHKIEHGGDFFKHLFDAVFKHGKEDIEKQFLKATIGFGKKIEEGEKAHEVFDVIKHILEKQKKIHELENGGELIKNAFEKIFVKTLEKGEKLEGIDHILEGKKELDKLLFIDGIKHLMEKKKIHEIGDESLIKYLLEKHIKHNKGELIEEKLDHVKKLLEGVKHVTEKEKETSEKLVEEFKHFLDKKMILHKLNKEGDIIKHKIGKEFVEDVVEGGKKLGEKLVEGVIEKEKDIKAKLVDEFKHIIGKEKILHKLNKDGDFIRHVIEAEFIKDAMEGGKKLVKHAVDKEKEIDASLVEHIKEKGKKLHEFENGDDFIKHVFEKVFKQDKEECIEDAGEKVLEDVKEKVKEKGDAFKHFVEKGIEFVEADHKADFIKHLLEKKIEHGKDKIKEHLHKLGKKLHEVENIGEFIKDVLHKEDGEKSEANTFSKLIGTFAEGKHGKHDSCEKEKILSESKHILGKPTIHEPLSHSAPFLKRVLPEKKVADCCPCACCCCEQDCNNNYNQGGTSNQGFTFKEGGDFVELYANPNYHDQGGYFG